MLLPSVSSSILPTALALLISSAQLARAATAEQWKSQSIYQLITDRFAPPSDSAPALTSPLPTVCDPSLQTWCGGTWRSIIDKLDYIQGMGMTAIWISPISQNIDTLTPYNFAYHGYWVNNQRSLNPRFGSSDDLKLLSSELHKRGMMLMVDIVVNNIPWVHDPTNTPLTSDILVADGALFTDPAQYHPYCTVDYSNVTSTEDCWLGDDYLALADVNTENDAVVAEFHSWIGDLVSNYSIDGLRLDAAKHIPETFWPPFCASGGVYCIGEVYGDVDTGLSDAIRYATHMDAILNYPVYFAMMDAFQLPGPQNISSLVSAMSIMQQSMPDVHTLGNFIENHDLPRFANTTVDPQSEFNAIAFQFLHDGIPIVYYGQEQGFQGIADPLNREPLWPSNYTNTTTYQRIGRFNKIRHWLNSTQATFSGETFLQANATVLKSDSKTLAIRKGPMLSILTNRGSPPTADSFAVTQSGWSSNTVLWDMFTCETYTVGSGGSILINYSVYGGRPVILAEQTIFNGSGICTAAASITAGSISAAGTTQSSAAKPAMSTSMSLGVLLLAGLTCLLL